MSNPSPRPKDLSTCLESEFTAWIVDALERDGAVVIPLVGFTMTSGWPDRLVYHRSWHGLIEFKRFTGKVNKRQAKNIRDLWRRRPGCAVVVRAAEPLCKCESGDGELLFEFADAEGLIYGLVCLVKAHNE